MTVIESTKQSCEPRATGYESDTDVNLMLRTRDGDDSAFAELVEKYWGRILGHFAHLLGDREECEDLTQDVFLRIYRSRHRYEPRAKFITWLFHVTRNVARNAIRSRRRRPCSYVSSYSGSDDSDFLEHMLGDGGEDPTRPLERKEVAEVVRAAVRDLGGRQRTAVELHQFKHRTYNEVAEAMDMSPEAAKSLLYRARNQLRELLSGFAEQYCLAN